MTVSLVVAVAVLYGVGTYLLLQRHLTRVVIGLAVISHGANLLLLLVGGPAGRSPIVNGGTGEYSDPLPQALAMTAIVISFAVTALLLAFAFRSWQITGSDEVEDDVEDRRIAGQAGHVHDDELDSVGTEA